MDCADVDGGMMAGRSWPTSVPPGCHRAARLVHGGNSIEEIGDGIFTESGDL